MDKNTADVIREALGWFAVIVIIIVLVVTVSDKPKKSESKPLEIVEESMQGRAKTYIVKDKETGVEYIVFSELNGEMVMIERKMEE